MIKNKAIQILDFNSCSSFTRASLEPRMIQSGLGRSRARVQRQTKSADFAITSKLRLLIDDHSILTEWQSIGTTLHRSLMIEPFTVLSKLGHRLFWIIKCVCATHCVA